MNDSALTPSSNAVSNDPSQLLQLVSTNQAFQQPLSVVLMASPSHDLPLNLPPTLTLPHTLQNPTTTLSIPVVPAIAGSSQTLSQPSTLSLGIMSELEQMQKSFPRCYGTLLNLASAQMITKSSLVLTNLLTTASNTVMDDENADLSDSIPAIIERIQAITNIASMLSVSISSLKESPRIMNTPKAKSGPILANLIAKPSVNLPKPPAGVCRLSSMLKEPISVKSEAITEEDFTKASPPVARMMTISGHVLQSIRTTAPAKQFRCLFAGCGRAFNLKFHLVQHWRIHHTGERPFVCCELDCKSHFASLRKLRAHKRMAHKVSKANMKKKEKSSQIRYQCPLPRCGRWFTLRRELKVHLTSHTGVKLFYCNELKCSSRFFNQEDLEKHRQQAHQPKDEPQTNEEQKVEKEKEEESMKKHKCPHMGCERSYTKLSKLVEHVRCHTGEKPFVCTHPDCGVAFARRYSLTRHSKVHAKSDQSASNTFSLNLNKETAVSPGVSLIAPSGLVPQGTPSPTSTLNLVSALKELQPATVASTIQPSLPTTTTNGVAVVTVEYAKSRCSVVQRSKLAEATPSAAALAEMAIVVRGASGVCRYICPVSGCTRSCPKLNKLREHLCRHTGERPYTCSHCQATFVRTYDLTRHLKMHTRRRDYSPHKAITSV